MWVLGCAGGFAATARNEALRSCQAPEGDCSGVAFASYPEDVVNPALQSAIEAMSLDERLELVEYIESTIESEPIELTHEQKAMIRSPQQSFRLTPRSG